MESKRVFVVAQLNQLQDPDDSPCSWGFWLFFAAAAFTPLILSQSEKWQNYDARMDMSWCLNWVMESESYCNSSKTQHINILVWNFLVLFMNCFIPPIFQMFKTSVWRKSCQDLRLLALCPFFRQFYQSTSDPEARLQWIQTLPPIVVVQWKSNISFLSFRVIFHWTMIISEKG